MATARLSNGFRGDDWRALLRQHRRTLWRATAASAIVVLVIVSAAWTLRALTGARTPSTAATVATAESPAPVLAGLAPKQKLRTRSDAQPLALTGRHLAEDMTVTISTPDGRVATYGSSSLSNVTPAKLTLRAIFDVQGTYHLVVRNADGTSSNEVAVVVAQ